MWQVLINRRIASDIKGLPQIAQERFDLLAKELEVAGPLRANWKSFGRLKTAQNRQQYHCHIKSGRPTFVACWEIIDKEKQIMEVYYAGTHEKAPY